MEEQIHKCIQSTMSYYEEDKCWKCDVCMREYDAVFLKVQDTKSLEERYQAMKVLMSSIDNYKKTLEANIMHLNKKLEEMKEESDERIG